MDQFFFGGWQSLFRTLVVGVLAYVTLLIFLRFSGKRTLSKMSAFDPAVSALRQARVTRDEIRAAVRAAGLGCLVDAGAVVLETDGSFSVIRWGEGSCCSSLDGVRDPRAGGTGD